MKWKRNWNFFRRKPFLQFCPAVTSSALRRPGPARQPPSCGRCCCTSSTSRGCWRARDPSASSSFPRENLRFRSTEKPKSLAASSTWFVYLHHSFSFVLQVPWISPPLSNVPYDLERLKRATKPVCFTFLNRPSAKISNFGVCTIRDILPGFNFYKSAVSLLDSFFLHKF